jgi:hypothetical protein
VNNRARAGIAVLATALCTAAGVAAASAPAHASAATAGSGRLAPGNLLVSESLYTKAPNIVAGQTQLPPGCTGSNCVTAVANGNYPQVFNNALVDGSFGVTSRIFVDEMTPSGVPLGTITVPPGRLVTSFSAAERHHPRRWRAADHAGRGGGHPYAGRQLQRHPAGR